MAEKENLDNTMIAVVGVVSIVLTVASIIGVQALYNGYANEELDRKVISLPTADANSKLLEQEAKLARYGWMNREKGQVAIPIERAMKLTLSEFRDRRAEAVSAGAEQ